jgi:hypothetical protein
VDRRDDHPGARLREPGDRDLDRHGRERLRSTRASWTESKVDTKNPDRGPLLILDGENDHTVPWAANT